MTHVLGLSAKVRRNEQLWQTLDICNIFGPNFWFQKFIVISFQGKKIYQLILNPRNFNLPTRNTFALPYTSPDLVKKKFK